MTFFLNFNDVAANQPTVSEEIDLKSQIMVMLQTMSQYCGYCFQYLEDKEYLTTAWLGL